MKFEELKEKAEALYKKLGGVGSADARIIRGLVEECERREPRSTYNKHSLRVRITSVRPGLDTGLEIYGEVKVTEKVFVELGLQPSVYEAGAKVADGVSILKARLADKLDCQPSQLLVTSVVQTDSPVPLSVEV